MAEALIHLVGDLSWVALFAYIVHCVHDYSVRRYLRRGPLYPITHSEYGAENWDELDAVALRLFDGHGSSTTAKKDQH